MAEDINTIGLTHSNKEVMYRIMQFNIFKEQQQVAKFTMSLAINNGIEPGETEGAETVWNVGTFDKSGELRSIIPAIFPGTQMPYRLVEYMINEGLKIIDEHLYKNNDLDIIELMSQGVKQ